MIEKVGVGWWKSKDDNRVDSFIWHIGILLWSLKSVQNFTISGSVYCLVWFVGVYNFWDPSVISVCRAVGKWN